MSAFDLLDRAWEAKTDATRAKHAKAALTIDPDALDGYVLLGQSLPSEAERIAALHEGVARGRRLWAKEMKRPAQSWFWADMDTRPFMRAVQLLALAQWNSGERQEAIASAKLLLWLNRNDNQGIRDLLAMWYPATGDWVALGKLLHRYRDDWSVGHLYAAWLLAFRDEAADRRGACGSVRCQSHVPVFLADPAAQVEAQDDDPLSLMGYVTVGSPGEAAAYADFARPAWAAVPGAIERLLRDTRTMVAE